MRWGPSLDRGDLSAAYRFVDAFARLRKLKRISLDELSAKTGIAKSWLSEMQNTPGGLSLVYAARIAEALGVPLSAMVGDDEASVALTPFAEQARHIPASVPDHFGVDWSIYGPLDADDEGHFLTVANFRRARSALIGDASNPAAERTKADSQARNSIEQPHQSKIPTQPQGEGEQSP